MSKPREIDYKEKTNYLKVPIANTTNQTSTVRYPIYFLSTLSLVFNTQDKGLQFSCLSIAYTHFLQVLQGFGKCSHKCFTYSNNLNTQSFSSLTIQFQYYQGAYSTRTLMFLSQLNILHTKKADIIFVVYDFFYHVHIHLKYFTTPLKHAL